MWQQSFARHYRRSNQSRRVIIVYSYSLLCSFFGAWVAPTLRAMPPFMQQFAVFLVLFLVLLHFFVYALDFQLELVALLLELVSIPLNLLQLDFEHLHGLVVHRVLVLIRTCRCCRSERWGSDQ